MMIVMMMTMMIIKMMIVMMMKLKMTSTVTKIPIMFSGGSNIHRPISLPLLWAGGGDDGLAGR